MALAGIDMAAWDALARPPACRSFACWEDRIEGPRLQQLRPGHHRPGKGARPKAKQLAEGFSAVKVRLGYADAKADLEVVRAVRKAVGTKVHLMSDYNQSLSVSEAACGPRR